MQRAATSSWLVRKDFQSIHPRKKFWVTSPGGDVIRDWWRHSTINPRLNAGGTWRCPQQPSRSYWALSPAIFLSVSNEIKFLINWKLFSANQVIAKNMMHTIVLVLLKENLNWSCDCLRANVRQSPITAYSNKKFVRGSAPVQTGLCLLYAGRRRGSAVNKWHLTAVPRLL